MPAVVWIYVMIDLSEFYGPNAAYVQELYDRFLEDPESVDDATRAMFAGITPAEVQAALTAVVPAPRFENASSKVAASASAVPAADITKIVAAARVTRMVREMGHKAAHLDPLGSPPPGDPELELSTHGLTPEDMMAMPPTVVGSVLAEGAQNAMEALSRLRRAYSGTIGYEEDHIQNPEERDWLREAAESGRFLRAITNDDRKEALARLAEVETFERFLHRTFPTDKRFSLEGNDVLVPMLDAIIREAAAASSREVVMGMAHRGRLNVLAHILGKPYISIMAEFKSNHPDDTGSVSGTGTSGWTGDVKYHMGFKLAYTDELVEKMPITLAPNPSHLEFVDPVVTGRARAAQESRDKPGAPVQDLRASLPILIHGDAAFPGQGVVAETLNLQQLEGYRVGGTIHIIVNNQIGFTTDPQDGRSTLYASDLAKGFEIPIVHVNADDPAACIAVARMAHAFRERFGKDFLIDLIGYRRYGHNEIDEPAFTQPDIYRKIAAHPRVREIWAGELERQGIVSREDADRMVVSAQEALQEAYDSLPSLMERERPNFQMPLPRPPAHVNTAVPDNRLRELNRSLYALPDGFALHATLERVIGRRREDLEKENAIGWGHAEALAFASILEDGVPIRITGQDTERGTFGHRNAVLHDPNTGARFCSLQRLPQARASFAIHNSPLSENAVLGFEYGYSIHATRALVLWEAQFGDFANSAQVMVDQFIVSGAAKWRQTPSLVLLLPHGYEGQGAEHSSARLERFLQLGAQDNICVANCTTAAQYFHLLRRQAITLETAPRPLVVMTPKYLLRHPLAASSLAELSTGEFHPVIDDMRASGRPDAVERLVLCSGKIWTELSSSKALSIPESVALVRVEQLYPFPADEVAHILEQYSSVREVVWLQEEPQNMGAWSFVAPRLQDLMRPGLALRYVGRPESASPAEGSHSRHEVEQARIMAAAVTIPTLRDERSEVVHAC